MAASNVIQLISRDVDRNNSFNEERMRRLITFCDAPKDHYTVVSIIGPQSSGKSTLMNGIFGTNFEVMDESKGRGRTTQGIWASICNKPRAVVLDVEGTDGVDNQNDLGFETRSALFALVISDVTIFNIWVQEVNRSTSIPLLANIFEEIVKQAGPQGLPQQKEKRLLFAVRNYNGKTKKEILENEVTSSIKKIWARESITQSENSKLERYFQLHVELFPDRDYREPQFNEKCQEIKRRIASGDWADPTLSYLPVCEFALSAKEIWDKIVKNETLDIPSYRATRSRASCENIMKKKFGQFVDFKYPGLIKPMKDDPKEFEKQLQQILKDILSDYDKETQVYGEHAKETKETLKMKILNYAEEEFIKVMKLFKNRISENCRNELQLECEKQQSLDKIEAGVNSVVEKYCAEFSDKTKVLKLYNNKLDHGPFLNSLEMQGIVKTADVKKIHADKEKMHAEKTLRVTKGVLLGVAGTAAGIVSVATIGPVVAAVGATAALVTAVTAGTVAAVSTGAAVAIEAVEGKNHEGSTGAAVQASRKLLEVEHKLDATKQGC